MEWKCYYVFYINKENPINSICVQIRDNDIRLKTLQIQFDEKHRMHIYLSLYFSLSPNVLTNTFCQLCSVYLYFARQLFENKCNRLKC